MNASDRVSGAAGADKPMIRRNWTTPAIRLGGVVLGLVFLWVAVSRGDVHGAISAVRGANFFPSAVVLACSLLFMALKTLRWRFILQPVARVDYGRLHRLVYIGTAANILIPHSGELLRSTQLARQHDQPLFSGTVLGTVAVERLLDFATLALLAALALTFEPRASSWLWMAGLFGLGLVVVGVVIVAALLDPQTPLKKIGRWGLRWLPDRLGERLHHHIHRGVEGLGTLRSSRRLLVALAMSVVQWSMVVCAVWASCIAMGQFVSLSAAIAVFVLTVVGLTLPSAPGQVGTTQLAFVAGLQLSGGDASLALASSIVYNIWFVLAAVVIGAVLWFRTPRPGRGGS